MTGPLTAFLEGHGTDQAGRRISTVLAWDNHELEWRHDYIQWLFPLPAPSVAVPGSPVLSAADTAHLRGSAQAQANLQAATRRLRAFYAATDHWRVAYDHNHLRITRVIRSLRLLAGDAAADAFRAAILEQLGPEPQVNPQSQRFWAEA